MKIGVMIFILFVQFMIIGSFGGLHSFYLSSKTVLTEETNEYFGAIVQSRANHVKGFLYSRKLLAEELALIGKVEGLLLADTNDSDYNDKIEAVNRRLQKTADSTESILELAALDKNGIVLVSTDNALIGLDFSQGLFFQKPEKETTIEFVEHPSKGIFLGVAAPVKEQNTGEYIGMLGAFMDINDLNKITIDRTGLGKTGEIYLINKDGYMITPARFLLSEETFLKQKVDTVNSRDCFSMMEMESTEHIGHESVNVFEDYRGVEVLGTHSYIPEMQWCLLAEIDETEALGDLRNKLLVSGIVIAIIILVIMMFFIFLSESFIRKIVEQVKRGERK